MSEQKVSREIISPEGVEERVELEITFRMTLTGGGKYRVYMEDNGKVVPNPTIFTDKESGEKSIGTAMLIHGGMMLDPEKTIGVILDGLLTGRKAT